MLVSRFFAGVDGVAAVLLAGGALACAGRKGSRMVRELFVMAREAAPSIIFMDEIDSIGSSRVEGSEGGDSEVQRTMLELLNQLDGFEPTQNIKVRRLADRFVHSPLPIPACRGCADSIDLLGYFSVTCDEEGGVFSSCR